MATLDQNPNLPASLPCTPIPKESWPRRLWPHHTHLIHAGVQSRVSAAVGKNLKPSLPSLGWCLEVASKLQCPGLLPGRGEVMGGRLQHLTRATLALPAHHTVGWAGPAFCADADVFMSTHTQLITQLDWVVGGGLADMDMGTYPCSPSHGAGGARHPLQGRHSGSSAWASASITQARPAALTGREDAGSNPTSMPH